MPETIASIQFSESTHQDNAEIRRLLRENPMPGKITLTLEQEPDYFAESRHLAGRHRTIVARHNERIVCVGGYSVQERFINGEPVKVGYLKGLRLDSEMAGRFDIVRRGYRYFCDTQTPEDPEFYFTSIAADNRRAIQFLERGLPGMPKYEHLANFMTLLFSIPRRPSVLRYLLKRERRRIAWRGIQISPAEESDAAELATLLNEHSINFQLTPRWTSAELRQLPRLGLNFADFVVARNGTEIVACAALWDQRSYKQAVVRQYGAPLSYLRWAINGWQALNGYAGLPPIDVPVPTGFVCHVAVKAREDAFLPVMFAELLLLAARKSISFLTLGFGDWRLSPNLIRFLFPLPRRRYFSRLYWVRLPGLKSAPIKLDYRNLRPEVALL